MSMYTAEQVEAEIANYAEEAFPREEIDLERVTEMLRDYAALLHRHESAKAAVTNEMVETACKAAAELSVDGFDPCVWPDDYDGDELRGARAFMRLALEAVAPMLASARVSDGWRSIESAPKDGTAVLLAFRKSGGEYSVHIGRWDAETFAKHPRPYWRGDRGYLGVTYYRNSQPTHWQPIAAAPKPETEE